MKILKSKIAVALMLCGLMSGMLSFSTTPISAQSTSSSAVVGETDDVRISAAAARRLAQAAFLVGTMVAMEVGSWFGSNNNGVDDYPTNALD